MNNTINKYLEIKTTVSKEKLTEQIKSLEPWSHKVVFSNGVSTENGEKRTPFNEFPLRKLIKVYSHIPLKELRGGTLLDIGSNIGFNSIYASQNFGLKCTGIDVVKKHIEKAKILSELANVKCNFIQASAENFVQNDFFDVILHLGTLYHLPNPILSLSLSYQNLKKGGWLALETQTFDNEQLDPKLCYFIQGFNNDKTNFWALSTPVLIEILEHLNFTQIKEISRVHHNKVHLHMYRVLFVCRK